MTQTEHIFAIYLVKNLQHQKYFGIKVAGLNMYLYRFNLKSNLCILGGTRKQLISIKTKHENRLNLEPALILAPKKISPRVEALACQKQARPFH
jgi:hypothetical protein